MTTKYVSAPARYAADQFWKAEKLRERADKIDQETQSVVNQLNREELAEYVKLTTKE